jgi:hypothetical protein
LDVGMWIAVNGGQTYRKSKDNPLWFVFRFVAEGTTFISETFIPAVHAAHTASYTTNNGDSSTESKAAVAWSWPLTSIRCWDQEYFKL